MAGAFSITADTRDCERAFALTEPTMRENMSVAIDLTAKAVAQNARALVPVRTGALKSFIDSEFNKRTLTARVGIRKGSVAGPRGPVYPSVYGRMVHNGSIHNYPVPFMVEGAAQERAGFAQRAKDAGRQTERDLNKAYQSRGGDTTAITSGGAGSGGLL